MQQFGPTAIQQIGDTIRAVKAMAGGGNGTVVPPARSFDDEFWVQITGNDSLPNPYYYAWTEQYDSGTGTGSANPPVFSAIPSTDGGRSGTITVNYAVNALEESGAYAGPVPNGTYVKIKLTFDQASPPNPVWRFSYNGGLAWIKLTSPQAAYSAGPPPAGGGAYYNASLVSGAPITIDPTTDLVAPIDPCEAVGTTNGILAMNWAEANLGDPPTHWVQCPTFVPAWYVGMSNEEPARPVYRFYVPRPGPVDGVVIDALGSSGTAGGRYKIAVMLGSVIGLNTATNFHGTDNGTSYPNTFNAYWTNVFEGGSATSGTNLVDVGSFVRGSFVGMASDGNPAFYGSSAPTGTTFAVVLSQSGGTSPLWTYNATTLGGLPLTPVGGGSPIGPDFRQGWPTTNAAASGLGYINQTGVFRLKYADESINPESCP